MREVDEAIDRVIVGTEKRSRVISEREKRIVAYHEAGHTIVGYFLENADMVHKVTIIPRGRVARIRHHDAEGRPHARHEAGIAG